MNYSQSNTLTIKQYEIAIISYLSQVITRLFH